MENKFIRSKHQITQLMNNSYDAIAYFRMQNFDSGIRSLKTITEGLSCFIGEVLNLDQELNQEGLFIDQNQITEILKELLDAQRDQDYILLADLLQLSLMPWCQDLMYGFINLCHVEDELLYLQLNVDNANGNLINCDNVFTEEQLSKISYENYHLEYTSFGEVTARYGINKCTYLHSNVSPSCEGADLAKSWSMDGKQRYIMYGIGLGYHVKKLLEMQSYIEVVVYEHDIAAITLALSLHDFSSELQENRLKIIYDPDYLKLVSELSSVSEETDSFIVHYASLKMIDNTEIRNVIETYFLQYSSIQNQLLHLQGNFNRNVLIPHLLMSDLEEKFKDKDLYIVAAGPSLDLNYRLLANLNRENAIILATGTVLRKLVSDNIKPDYVIITDANERMSQQIKGYENVKIPLIFLSTTYFGVVQNYQGQKYMLCQNGFPLSVSYAQKHMQDLVETGGSVSTTALDLGIRLGCNRIVFIGLDLSFPNGYLHALMTSSRLVHQDNHLMDVYDINGNTVKTSKSMMIYKKWIEERIREARREGYKGSIIDATEGGAKIEEMKIMTLSDAIQLRKGDS